MSTYKQMSVGTGELPEGTGGRPRLKWTVAEGFCGTPFLDGVAEGKQAFLRGGINLSHRRAPAVATRRARGIYAKMVGSGNANGMVFFGGYRIYARGTGLYATADGVSHLSLGTVTDTEKLFLVMGDWLYVYPDKIRLQAGALVARGLELDTGVMRSCSFRGSTVTLPEGQSWLSLGFEAGDCMQVVNEDDDTPAPHGYYHIASTLGRTATIVGSFPSTYESDARFLRTVPTLETGCVSDGRIIGTVGNQIYISARGSGTDFYSADRGEGNGPAILSSGGEGALTACTPWQGYVIFFKADGILRLLGSRPDSYSLSDGGSVGLPAPYAASLCEVGGSLYFLSDGGVYRYRGQEAVRISSAGECSPDGAVGGTDGVSYYLCVTVGGERRLWVYSPQRECWYGEETPRIVCMRCGDGLVWMQNGDGYLRVDSSEGRPHGMTRNDEQSEGPVRAELVTVPLGVGFPEQCHPVEAALRVTLDGAAQLEVYAACDGGAERLLKRVSGAMADRVIRMPLPAVTAEGVTLRVVMSGDCVIHAVACGFEA